MMDQMSKALFHMVTIIILVTIMLLCLYAIGVSIKPVTPAYGSLSPTKAGGEPKNSLSLGGHP